MKLNPDCIRDLMMFLEEKTWVTVKDDGRSKFSYFHVLCPALIQELDPVNKYSLEEVLYHIIQLSESGYISTDFTFNPSRDDGAFRLARVYYITPKGHELIASIEEDKRWNKIKKILAPLGSVSLAVIESVASGVTSAIIEKSTGQTQSRTSLL